jgi:hypothetical protein
MSPDPEDAPPGWQHWGAHGWQQRQQLRRSVLAVHLFDWLEGEQKYVALLGREGYRQQVLAWLAQASADDCVAAGFALDGALASRVSDTFEASVLFSPTGQHRAVCWREADWPAAQAWVDGEALDAEVDAPGHWAAGRLYAVAVAGPRDHPQQDHASFGSYLGSVKSLLVWDAAGRRRAALVEPRADEAWSQPVAAWRDGTLQVFSDLQAAARGKAARLLTLEMNGAGAP